LHYTYTFYNFSVFVSGRLSQLPFGFWVNLPYDFYNNNNNNNNNNYNNNADNL